MANRLDPPDSFDYGGHHDDCCHDDCHRCVICPPGPPGPRGPAMGGPTGPTGATGAAGPGAIIPFASGTTTILTTVLEGIGTQAAVGFGNAGAVVTAGGIIDLTGLSDYAFSMPRIGTITSLAAYYSVAVAAALPASIVTITAQMYSSPTPNDSFTPIPGATVVLAPPLTGAVVAIGTIASGLTTGLSIPVSAGTRLMLVFTATVTGGTGIATTLTGFASGGLTIA